MLGPPTGWHAEQLRGAAARQGYDLDIASYESIGASLSKSDSSGIASRRSQLSLSCEAGSISDYGAILTRTMAAGTFERITFRLAALHAVADQLVDQPIAIVNPPRSLEWSIDKFAALARLNGAGYPTPPTRIVQSRGEAMQAFEELGGDCVVKPIFGGEGRGVMRITDPQLAWYSFSTLDQLGAVIQVQSFIAPGGRDTRVLVVGDRVFGIRRRNPHSFRSNVSAGAVCEPIEVDGELAMTAKRIADLFGLVFASVDLIDNDHGPSMFLEVNAIPGWKGAQGVLDCSIADCVIETLATQSERAGG
jgi:ribosomal protein S6--L-glutamate ligase